MQNSSHRSGNVLLRSSCFDLFSPSVSHPAHDRSQKQSSGAADHGKYIPHLEGHGVGVWVLQPEGLRDLLLEGAYCGMSIFSIDKKLERRLTLEAKLGGLKLDRHDVERGSADVWR